MNKMFLSAHQFVSRTLTLGIFVLLLAVPSLSALTNAVTITEWTGTAQVNRPVTVSRLFAQGEIPNYAEPRIGSSSAGVWQCDRKSTWKDGSLKHAVISLYMTLQPRQAVVLNFVNNPVSSSSGSALTQQQMLDFKVGPAASAWNADIEIAKAGVLQSAVARTMLASGSWRYWLQGPAVTQVIVEDQSPALAFDLGFDSAKPLHPMFVLSFYPGSATVKIESVMENCWTTKLEDVSYDLTIKNGANLTNVTYSHSGLAHYAMARWRKTSWSGTTPAAVKTDLNLPYMISTKAIPNYDLSVPVTSSDVSAEVTAFNASDKGVDFGSAAEWNKYFPSTGGRPDIGFIPRWYIRYLYTFDPSLLEVLTGNAEASGHVPVHLRESRTGTTAYCASSCDSTAETVPAFGRAMSLDARPTVWYDGYHWGANGYSDAKDVLTPIGAITAGGWTPDTAHQGGFSYIPYLVTGDWYYLSELMYWAHWNIGSSNPARYSSLGRGREWGYINSNASQTRGTAWGLRTLLHAAFMAPDGTPELQYLTAKIANNAAIAEGVLNITNGNYPPSNTSCPGYANGDQRSDSVVNDKWCFGRKTVNFGRSNPLNYPSSEAGNLFCASFPYSQIYFDCAQSPNFLLPWTVNFLQLVSGAAVDMGFTQFGPFQDRIAGHLIQVLKDPNSDPYFNAAGYYYPTLDSTGNFLSSWASVRSAYKNMSSQLSKTVSAADTTIAVSDASGFDGFNNVYTSGVNKTIRIDNELIAICGRNGNTLTVGLDGGSCPGVAGRHYQGTTANAHSAGASVTSDYQNWFFNYNTLNEGYPWIARSAAAFVVGHNGGGYTGQSAWDWINGALQPNLSTLNGDPRWALIPRTTLAAKAVASCDVNGDGVTNLLDVQAEISEAVHSSCKHDLNGDGRCDVTDFQIVLRAALGGSCQ